MTTITATSTAERSDTTAQRTGCAFDDLVRQYQPELRQYAYRLSGNRQVAEDLVQDALVRAWRSLERLQNPLAIKGWLYTIVRRENARRFVRQGPQGSGIPPEDLASQRRDYDTSTEAFVLRRAVRALPAEYREPLILKVLHGWSQQEIAERLSLTSAGVGTRLFRARQKLREALGAVA